ncbi:ABC transporter substrate-binding protein [Streptomyces sp. E11-3]|uniref:ABC transporter substrate-binding protein n=1 Tax=Streptomyces sp. E11-3 TaxID=3110112 RepID=UPI003980AABF
MVHDDGWEFTDDRGVTVRAGRRPERVLAYVRAGAALSDLGVAPVAVYGSAHDGPALDQAKAGALRRTDITYLGPGAALDAAALRDVRPDLVLDVTYDGTRPYAVDEAAARAADIPVLALSVAGTEPLPAILRRFTELAAALGRVSEVPVDPDAQLSGAEQTVRAAAASGPPLRVLALSAAASGDVHLARPDAWPELRHLAGLGVRFVHPDPAGGVNWHTTTWEQVGGLGADLVLADCRGNAVQPPGLDAVAAWRTLTTEALVEPWNPELPCSPAACSAYFRAVADALVILRDKRSG